MKRLIELPPDDRLTARAHVLVRAMGSTPVSEERLWRLRRALDAPPPRAARWTLRLTLAAALLGVSAAAAAATGAWPRFAEWTRSTPTAPVRIAPVRPPRLPTPARELAPTASAQPAAAAAESSSNAPAAAAPSRRPGAAPTGPSPGSADVARVHEAAKALRHDGDAARALQLLEGKPVGGPLAEEALALRIEASSARHDGQTAKLAAAYLAQYPRGRYRDLASRALSSGPP